jgi:CDP-diacylglycerol--glycerol-3-phosphate 3-phosphatidyltransferase
MQPETTSPRQLWRNVPNAISIARLCATSVLLASVVLHRVELFRWLLLTCLLSDILDGLIARAFHLTSKLGASLDSIADVLTMLIGTLGLVEFQRTFVSGHYRELLLLVAFYCAEVIASLWRYGKLSSFHTLLARVAAYMAGIFVMSLFFWGYHGWLFYMTVIVYVAELSEEMVLIYLLPEWRSDVGGLVRVLNGRGANS